MIRVVVSGTGKMGATVLAAIEALAAVSGRMPEEIEVLSVTPMQWPDACLGLPEADEACAEVITPGYEVTLSLDDDVSVYRTDESSNVRLAVAENNGAAQTDSDSVDVPFDIAVLQNVSLSDLDSTDFNSDA